MIGECYYSCQTCLLPADQLACLSCKTGIQYFLSCQNSLTDPNSFVYYISIFMVVSLILMFLLMLVMGLGVLREAFENLQLAMLVSWSFGMQQSTTPLLWLNLGTVSQGTDLACLIQFFVVLAFMLAFISFGLALEGRTNTAFSLMFRRKKIIFPFRLYTYFYNFFMTASLAQLLFLAKGVNTGASNFVVAFLCLIFLLAGLGLIIFKLNFSSAKLDDPRYYALVQKQISTKFASRNQIVFSLLFRLVIIAAFVGAFGTPLTAQILILSSQSIYILYFVIFARYQKWRWWAVNLFSNVILLAMLACSCQYIRSSNGFISKIVWFGLLLLFTVGLMAALLAEFAASFMQIKRHLRSVYVRFIRMEKQEQELTLNKYDKDFQKEKVTEFVENPLSSNIRPLQADNDLL